MLAAAFCLRARMRPGFVRFLPRCRHGEAGRGSYFFFLTAFGFGSGVSACGSKPI